MSLDTFHNTESVLTVVLFNWCANFLSIENVLKKLYNVTLLMFRYFFPDGTSGRSNELKLKRNFYFLKMITELS